MTESNKHDTEGDSIAKDETVDVYTSQENQHEDVKITNTEGFNNESLFKSEAENTTNSSKPEHRITDSYFCFECGSVMTTKDDKKLHTLMEINRFKEE